MFFARDGFLGGVFSMYFPMLTSVEQAIPKAKGKQQGCRCEHGTRGKSASKNGRSVLTAL